MKRLTDIVLILISLPLIFPVFLIVALLCKLNLGSPVLFRQSRPGLNGKIFDIVKFRTMSNKHEMSGEQLQDSARLDKFGVFLRSTSLDELPELWNVLKGEMSLVGPRPLLVEYIMLYSEQQSRRHEVRPGITGWAQINGRNSISWKDRLEMDVWYVENRSYWLDIKILWKTVFKVLKRDGINQDGHATMSYFSGNQNKDNNA